MPDGDAAKSALGLTCNIDRRGRRARGALGAILLVAATVCFVVGVGRDGAAFTGAMIAGAALAVGGLFCLFEAANAWCAVRAMGFRTKL